MKGFFGGEETHSEAHRGKLSTKQREDWRSSLSRDSSFYRSLRGFLSLNFSKWELVNLNKDRVADRPTTLEETWPFPDLNSWAVHHRRAQLAGEKARWAFVWWSLWEMVHLLAVCKDTESLLLGCFLVLSSRYRAGASLALYKRPWRTLEVNILKSGIGEAP